MIHVSVKAEVQEVVNGLEELGLELRGISRKILRALATLTKKRVKKRMGHFIRRRTYGFTQTGLKGGALQGGDVGGSLHDAVYGFARSPTHAVVSSGMKWQAEILERGGTIVPKKAKFLEFFGSDGSYKRLKSVRIPAFRWFSRSSEGFESDPEYQSTIDKVVGKAIQKALKTS